MNWVFSILFLWELLNKALAEECQGCLIWIVEHKPLAQRNSYLQSGWGVSGKTTPTSKKAGRGFTIYFVEFHIILKFAMLDGDP